MAFGHCRFGGGSKRLPRWFGALINRRTIQSFRMVKYGPKKVPQSAWLSAGGSNRYLGNSQMKSTCMVKGFPLWQCQDFGNILHSLPNPSIPSHPLQPSKITQLPTGMNSGFPAILTPQVLNTSHMVENFFD